MSACAVQTGILDLDLLVCQYDPPSAVDRPPKERVELLRRLTGLVIPEADTARVLSSMTDLESMAKEPLLYPYLLKEYPREEFIEALTTAHILEAVLELDRLGFYGSPSQLLREPEGDSVYCSRVISLFAKFHHYDKRIYRWLKENHAEELDSNLSGRISFDLALELCEPGEPLYIRLHHYLTTNTVPKWDRTTSRAVIQRWPEHRGRLQEIVIGALQSESSLSITRYICNALVELAHIGVTTRVLSQGIPSSSREEITAVSCNKLITVDPRAAIDIQLSGLDSLEVQWEKFPKLNGVHYEVYHRERREMAKRWPLPRPLSATACLAVPGADLEISDEELIGMIKDDLRVSDSMWYDFFEEWITSLPLKRRVLFRRELQSS